MRDIIPSSKNKPATKEPLLEAPPQESPLDAPELEPLLTPGAPLKPQKRHILRFVAIVTAAIILIMAAGLIWYNIGLGAKGGTLKQLVVVQIPSGSTPSDIGNILQEKSVIKNALIFDIYTRLSGTKDRLQAGTYRLSPAENVPEIVQHLVKGTVDEFSITFLPGATLAENKKVLQDAGYSAQEIDTAFADSYDSPLFSGKPASSDLEGYIYGETYNFNTGASVRQILIRTFDQFYSVVKDDNLQAGFTKQGLSLYQAITLASIIQREVDSPVDQKQVAQVFYLRLLSGMPLGSDVTYIYAAKKLGVVASPNLDSPYNTRIHTGLPPGPIASPGFSALQAVAAPASGTFVYFLSGDDNKTYFSYTNEQHEANIAAHCTVKCSQ